MIWLEPKRSDENRRYRHVWTPFLGEDTIASQTTVGTGVTVSNDAPEAGDQAIAFRLSGGTAGANATVKQTIVTASGDTEAETFVLQIVDQEVVTLAEAKAYLRIRSSDEDAKIQAMIMPAVRWIEDHNGMALIKRQFVERLNPEPSCNGLIRLGKGPLVSVDTVDYLDSASVAATLDPDDIWTHPPSTVLAYPNGWPPVAENDAFEIAYTAGSETEDVDPRLKTAVLTLIEGEFSEGYAYPERAIAGAMRCCAYVRSPVL